MPKVDVNFYFIRTCEGDRRASEREDLPTAFVEPIRLVSVEVLLARAVAKNAFDFPVATYSSVCVRIIDAKLLWEIITKDC